MALIGLICNDEEDRQKLSLLAGETGHLVHSAARLRDAVEMLQQQRPRLMLVVDGPDQDASVAVREMLRASPLLPVVVALKDRDAARAVALMKTGAAEVVPAPWTRENIQACVSKSLRFQGTVFAVLKPPRLRKGPIYLVAVLGFFAVAFGYQTVKRERAQRVQEELSRRSHWDLPYRHPAAMVFNENELWVADWFTQSVYAHDAATLEVKRVAHFPAETPVALALAGDTVWSATAAGFIARHLKDPKLTIVERVSAGPTLGLAFDGLYLWSIDQSRKVLTKRIPDAKLTATASYAYPGLRPSAIAYDGKTLWSLDSGNRELIMHNLERPDEAMGRVALTEYRDGLYRPVALGYDGKTFWTIGERQPRDAGPARLFRHQPPKL